MARKPLLGDLRVQAVDRPGGRRCYTIVWPEGTVHCEADGFLRTHEASGTDRTYAYLLVDHLRWRERECLAAETVTLRDLTRYMAALGADFRGPYGEPWRTRPLHRSTLLVAAACLKGFYLYLGARGVNAELAGALRTTRLPTRADRRRAFLGHVVQSMPSNPLAPRRVRRRHPKMLPEGAREQLAQQVRTARDRMIVAWLADGGFRIGELCGLHLVDLHLRENALCGECRSAHVHVCYRPGNVNDSAAKTKHPWDMTNGVVHGGLIKRASPAMVHTYFEYITTEYPRSVEHGMLLVQLSGTDTGQPLAPVAASRMLARAGRRAGLGPIKPHEFRHTFATRVLDASGGNLVIARDAGGWASATTVDQIYGHVDLHDAAFDAALRQTWGSQ